MRLKGAVLPWRRLRAPSAWVDRLEPRSMPSGSPVPALQLGAAVVRAATIAGPRLTPAVTSLTLINADTDQPVAGFTTLAAGTTLDLSTLPTTRLNVRANVNSATRSVRFGYDANASYRVESGAPFALASDAGGDYKPWTPTVGSHTIKATPFTATGATGSAGPVFSVSIRVVAGPVTPAVPVVTIAATDATAREPGGDDGVFTVTRTGPTTAPLTVNLVPAGTAAEGVDYAAVARTVVVPAGATWATVRIAAADDADVEPAETVVLKVVAGGGYAVGTQSSATVTILDDETVAPPPPPPPTGSLPSPAGLRATAAGVTTLALSWTAPAGVAPADLRGYRVSYAPGAYAPGAAGGWQTVEVTGGETSVTLNGLLPYTMYTVDVRAVDAGGAVGAAARALPWTAAPAGQKRLLYTFHLPKDKAGFRTLKPHVEVYDVDAGHKLVKQFPLPTGIYNVRGVAASAATNRMYVSYFLGSADRFQPGGLMCLDLTTGQLLWRKDYPSSVLPSVDRFDLTPDGRTIYMPVGEYGNSTTWAVIDAATGGVTGKIDHVSGPHNTIVSLDGRYAFLEGQELGTQPPAWKNTVAVVDTATNQVVRRIGPFHAAVRPFTITGNAGLVYATVNNWFGFQVADATTGKVLYSVAPPNTAQPDQTLNKIYNHGIALTPDEKRVFVVDHGRSGVHVWDVAGVPAAAPKYLGFVQVRKPGRNLQGSTVPEAANDSLGGPAWLNVSYDGRWLYCENGEIVDTATLKVVGQLRTTKTAADGSTVPGDYSHSRFMIEVDTVDGRPVRTTDQFAIGRVR